MIIIIDHDEIAQLQVTSGTGSLAGHTFHSTAVTKEAICVVVDQIESRLIEIGSSLCLSYSQTHGIRKTLAEWTSSDLDTWSILAFWVAWCNAVDRLLIYLFSFIVTSTLRYYQDTHAEGFDIIKGHLVAKKV